MACRFPVVLLLVFAISRAIAFGQQGPDSSSKSKVKVEQHAKTQAPTASGEASSVYRNTEFGFSYKVPFAWVDRTKAMEDDTSDPAKSKLLLAVFERPPEVVGDTINSAVIVTAESAASYPGLRSAGDYMGPLTELTTSKGFKASGDPYQFRFGTATLVRGDFVRNVGSLAMHQSSLVLLRKGFVISFTFIAGSEDEIDELVEKLSFGSPH